MLWEGPWAFLWEATSHIQGQKRWLHFAGAAVNRYPTSKVKHGSCASLDGGMETPHDHSQIHFLTTCKYVVFWGARSGDRLDFSLGACPSAFPLCRRPPRLFKYLPPCNISHVGFLHVHPHAKPSLLLDGPCIQLHTSFSLGEPRPELTATEVSEYSSKARHNHRAKSPCLPHDLMPSHKARAIPSP